MNSSMWKGGRLRIAEANPTYKERLRLEAAAAAACSAPAPAASQPVSSEELKIKLPNGETLHLPPGAVTGNKRRLFPAAAPGTACAAATHHSALYRVNRQWDAALEKRLASAAPDAAIFECARAQGLRTAAQREVCCRRHTTIGERARRA